MTEQEQPQSLTQEQLDLQAKLQQRMDQLAKESYEAGYADALLASLKPLKELKEYIDGNIFSVEKYLKEELKVTEDVLKSLDQESTLKQDTDSQ